MNPSIKISVFFVMILAILWPFLRKSPSLPPALQPIAQRKISKTIEMQIGDKYKPANQTSDANLSIVEMNEIKYEIDYNALAHSRENPPFEMRGGSGSGKVVDRKGNVLMESGKEIAILGVEVGPDKNHILVEGGDAVNFVLNPATGLKLQLPLTPPGANMLGFGWRWIGNTKLLGDSGVQVIKSNGASVNCCEGHNVVQTKLYVYDVATQKLAEVATPSKVTQPVVNVVDVSSNGHVHLVHDVPHVGKQQDLGWFKIDLQK